MIELAAKFAFWCWVGHVVVTKVAPTVYAKLQASSIDDMWRDVYAPAWEEDRFSE